MTAALPVDAVQAQAPVQSKGLVGVTVPATCTPYRWAMLGIYSFVGVLNFGMWLTYATLPTATDLAFHGMRAWMANLLSVIVGFGYLVGAVPAAKVLAREEGGLRRGMVWASLIALVSGGLRWLGGGLRSFWLVLLGQLLVGIAQPFFMAAPAQLSMEWFPAREHGLATSIAILSQVLGQAAIFLLGPAVASLPTLVVGQAVASAVMLALVWLFFSDAPAATPPLDKSVVSLGKGVLVPTKFSDAPQAPPDVPDAPSSLLRTRDFTVLTVASGTLIGAFWTFCTVVGHLLLPLGFSETQIGYIGFSFIGSGMAGLLCVGPLMDKTKAYRGLMLACAWASALTSLALLRVTSVAFFVPLLLVCGVLGFWLTAIQSVAVETAAEITYPVSESSSTGIIFGVAVGCCPSWWSGGARTP